MRINVLKNLEIPAIVILYFLLSTHLLNNSPQPKISYAVSDTFDASGTWVAPNGVYAVDVECWGGGGGGGGSTKSNKTNYGGAGGGGGGYAKTTSISVTPGQGYQVIVGGSGAGGAVAGNGGPGGNSSFNTNTVIAVGGGGGGAGTTSSSGTPGSGGTGNTGTTTYNGGNGAAGTTSVGGGGGEGSGSTSNGGNASGQTGGTGTDGGDGGNGGNSGVAGNPGNVPGGAGGGAGKGVASSGYTGGVGSPGRCIVTYTDTWAPSTSQTTYSPTWSFSSIPVNVSSSQIDMAATTGYDLSTPIEYLFTLDTSSCPSGHAGTGGTSSSWQTGTSYSDTGLDTNKCYGYKVQSRDSNSPQNSGTASAVSYTYTSANTPGTPSLSNATLYTLDIDNDSSGNPSSDPTTLYAAQMTRTVPTDLDWEGKWIDTGGSAASSEVWMTDSQLDAITILNLNHTSEYGVSIKAKNEDGEETGFSGEGVSSTIALVISVTISPGTNINFGMSPPATPKSTLDLVPQETQTAQSLSNINVDLKIKSTNAIDGGGGSDWVLGSTPGFYFRFSTNSGGLWSAFENADTYIGLVDNVAPNNTQDFDLQITVPTNPTDGNEKTLTVTVMAVEPPD